MRLTLLFSLIFMPLALWSQGENENRKSEDRRCIETQVSDVDTGSARLYKTCVIDGVVSVSGNVDDDPSEKEEKQKSNLEWQYIDSRRNVLAQESIAQRTKIIVWLTTIGVIINAAGLCFIRRTIKQNRETFDHIQKTSVEEFKPYLKFGPLKAVYVTANANGEHRMHMSIVIANTGKSAARLKLAKIEYLRVTTTKIERTTQLPEMYIYECQPSEIIRGVGYIAPGQTGSLDLFTDMSLVQRSSLDMPGELWTSFTIKGFVCLEDTSTDHDEFRKIDFVDTSNVWTEAELRNSSLSRNTTVDRNVDNFAIEFIDIGLSETPRNFDKFKLIVFDDEIVSKKDAYKQRNQGIHTSTS